MTARTGAGILAAASLDARRRAPRQFPLPASASDDRARSPLPVTRSGVAASLRLFVAAAAVYGEREGERERESARAEAELRVLVRYGSFIGLGAADCCCSEFPAFWMGGRACFAFYPVPFARSAGAGTLPAC
jgi:hypothetical protein